ncbi:DUF2079 domain-containing protein [Hymenobacter caeli]|uniref:Membrane protein n=1 Tax=Hymenobacter caeli TaxID=2735894 RepID=A0ABX2FPX4_9BACT|nr:DUF2079 domain-containing protein [Hymenobacter caeli]NRT19230.1 putative membrane protein [Hymenobacter caeli]
MAPAHENSAYESSYSRPLGNAPAGRRRGPALPLALAGVVYALVSLVNQYNFRTAALDLGLAAQVVGDWAHGRVAYAALLLDSPPTNFLSVHFSLTPVLAVPLYWLVGGAWALLLMQLGAVLLGALGVWRYARARGATGGEARWALAFFCCQWGIFSALGFDYHDNVVGAMAVPWLALWAGQGRWGWAAAAALFLLVSKENMALWLVFVLLGLAWQHRHRRGAVAGLGLAAAGALGYFLLVTHWVMPALDVAQRPFSQVVRYRQWGASVPGMAWNLLCHPQLLAQALFCNTDPSGAYDYVKLELWGALLCSGALALRRQPWYALMLVPIVGQKLLANDPALWGINQQYSIEFAPVLALALVDAVRRRPAGSARRRGWRWALAGAAGFTLVTLYARQSKWYDRATTNFLTGRHYRCPYDRAALRAALARLPARGPLSVQSNLVPQLPAPRRLYLFPVLRDAAGVVLLRHPDEAAGWPLRPEESQKALAQLRARPDFRVAYEDAQLVVFARRGPVPDPAEVLHF